MQGGFIGGLCHAVENHHVRLLHFLHGKLAHIGKVGGESGGIGHRHHLKNLPALGQCVIQHLHGPHAVVLYQHPVYAVLFGVVFQKLPRQSLLAFYRQHGHVAARKFLRLVFYFAVLAKHKQRFFPGVEIRVLQGFLNKAGFARLQKAKEYIKRNSHAPPSFF